MGRWFASYARASPKTDIPPRDDSALKLDRSGKLHKRDPCRVANASPAAHPPNSDSTISTMTEPNPTSAPTTDAPKDGDGGAENASGQDSKPQQPAPITEGARAKQFREVFRTALRQSLKKCSYANFASCFPTPAKKNPELLKSIWEQMCTFWDTHAQVGLGADIWGKFVGLGINGHYRKSLKRSWWKEMLCRT